MERRLSKKDSDGFNRKINASPQPTRPPRPHWGRVPLKAFSRPALSTAFINLSAADSCLPLYLNIWDEA